MPRLASLIFALLLPACASTEFNPYPGAPGYRAHGGEVRLLDVFPQEGSYETVGIILARGVDLSEKEDLIKKLKAEAAKQGANAIVLQGDVKIRSRGNRLEKLLGAYALKLKP